MALKGKFSRPVPWRLLHGHEIAICDVVQASQQAMNIMIAVTKACIPMTRMSLLRLSSHRFRTSAHANIIDGTIFMTGRRECALVATGVCLIIRGIFDHFQY